MQRIRRGAGPLVQGVSGLDVRLGARMLLKYPGLSIISIFALATAIASPEMSVPMTRSNRASVASARAIAPEPGWGRAARASTRQFLPVTR